MFFPGRTLSSPSRVERLLPVDAEHAVNKRAGAPFGMGIGGVLVAVDECDLHESTVAGAGASGQGGGVRGWAALRQAQGERVLGWGRAIRGSSLRIGLAFGA